MRTATARWHSPDFDDSIVEDQSTTQWSFVIPVPWLSAEQKSAIQKLIGLQSLPKDWDSYGGAAPTPLVVSAASQLIAALDFDELPVPYIVPVSGGGVQLEWKQGNRELEVEILDDGSATYLKIERGTPVEEGQINKPRDMHPIVTWLVWGSRR